MAPSVRPQQLSDADYWEQEYRRTGDADAATAAVEARKQPSSGGKRARTPLAAPSFAPADQVKRGIGPRPKTNAATAALAGLGQGVTLGGSDEILGGLDALNASLPTALGGEGAPLREFPTRYVKSRDRIRGEEAQMAAEHGGAHLAGEVAGGVLSGGLLDRALVAAGMKALPQAASLGQKVAHGMKTGAAIGATAGFGAGEGDVGDQLKSTAGGAAAGLTLGGILPLAGAALAKGASATKAAARLAGADAVTDAVADAGAKVRGVPVPDRSRSRALDLAAKALEQSGKTTADVRAMGATGKPVALVDAGENTRALARVARSAPGKAKQAIPDALEGRQSAQLERVAGDVEGKLGSRKDVFQTADELAAAREAEATPLYQKAFAHGPVDDPRVAQLMQLPYFQKAWQQAKRLAQLDEVKLPEIAITRKVPTDLSKYTAQLEAQGVDPAEFAARVQRGEIPQIPAHTTVTEMHEVPTVEALHHLKLGLDDVLADAKRAPLDRGGITPTMEAKLLKKRQELLDILDQHTGGDYTTARQAYAGRSKVMEALEDAKGFLTEHPAKLKTKIANMSAAEREMYRTGAVDEIRRAMDQTGEGRDVIPKLLGNTERKARLRSLFGDDEAGYNDLIAELKHEKTMVDSRNKVLGGSQTAFNTAEQDAAAPHLASAALNAVTGAPRRAVGQVARVVMRRANGVNEAVAGHLADILTAGVKDPADLNAVLDALDERALRRLNKATKSRLGRTKAALGNGKLTRGASAAAALTSETPSAPMREP